MADHVDDPNHWLDAQIEAAGRLVTVASKALRQRKTTQGAEALAEAEAILEMAERETDRLLKMRARVFNEFGVVHQRRDELPRSADYHRRAADICDDLMEEGDRQFASNTAATYLNLSSVLLAMGEEDEAQARGERAIELLDELDEDDTDSEGPNPLELGARQNLAVIYARQGDWEKSEETMSTAREIAEELADAGRPNFLAQLAQGCQQLSVIFFENDRHDGALSWGRAAEELAEQAFDTMGQQVLPIYIVSQINLISYNEKLGRFADGEDCLWKALDVAGNDPRVLQRGVAFYETCRKQADKRLEKGNLPREEVDDGYEELMGRVEAAGGLEKIQQQARRARQSRSRRG